MTKLTGNLISSTYKSVLFVQATAISGNVNGAITAQTTVQVNDVDTTNTLLVGMLVSGTSITGDPAISTLTTVNTSTYNLVLDVAQTLDNDSALTFKPASGFVNEGVKTTLQPVYSGDGTKSALEVATGKVAIAGDLCVSGEIHGNIKGDVCVSSLRVTGGVTIANSLNAGGNTSIGGTLVVAGKADFDDDVCVSGDTILVGGLNVGGNVTITGNTTMTGDLGVGGAFRVSTNASIGGTLDVAGKVCIQGDIHVSSKCCASAFFGDGSNITGIPISGDLSVTDLIVNGSLTVNGSAAFGSNVSVSGNLGVIGNVSAGGTLDVAGNTSLGGTAIITGNTTLTANLGVGGTFRVSTNASIGGTLDVNGNVCLGGNVTVKGNVHVSNQCCASAFFGDGANLTNVPVNITGNISVNNATIGGNLYVGGTVTVIGNAVFDANVSVSGTGDIKGNVSIGGTLITTGKAEFEDDVSVSGNSNFGGTVTISGAVSLGSTLDVAGNTSLGGTATITGAVSLGSTLDVTGNTSIGGTFLATGKAEFEGNVSVSGNMLVGGNVTIVGNTTLTGNLGVGGTFRVSSNTSLEGNLVLSKSGAAAVHTTAIDGVTSVSLNFSTAQNFFTSVTAAHTLAQPVNAKVGQVGSIFLWQDGGSGSFSYNSCWNFPGGTAPTMSTADNAVDRLDYIVLSVSSDGTTGENIQAVMTQAYS